MTMDCHPKERLLQNDLSFLIMPVFLHLEPNMVSGSQEVGECDETIGLKVIRFNVDGSAPLLNVAFASRILL